MADKSSMFVESDKQEAKERIGFVLGLRNALQRFGPRTVLNDLKDLDLSVYEDLLRVIDERHKVRGKPAAIFKDPYFNHGDVD